MKRRQELPSYLRLNHKFDIDKLRKCYEENKHHMESKWDAITVHCAADRYIDVDDLKYTASALTKFEDNGFAIRGKKKYDERNYTQVLDWVKGTYFEEVLNSFSGKPSRARILTMLPGGKLLPHIDYNTDYNIRIHIPIYTNSWALFGTRRQGEEVVVHHMPADGHCWFVNVGWEHSAWNFGDTPRVHLIFAMNNQEDIEDALSS